MQPPSDWERFLGLFAALTANSGSMFATVVGLMGISYGFFYFIGTQNPKNLIYHAFCAHFPYTHLCTLLFFIAQCLLLRKYHFVLREWRAFGLEADIFPQDSGQTLQQQGAEAIAAKIRLLPPPQGEYLLIQRLDRGLQRLRNTGSSSDMSGVLGDLSNIDRQTAESGYTFVRFLVAVIPIIGFIATVLGISGGVTGFSHAIGESSGFDENLRRQLQDTTKSLGMAFEATFVALIESALIMFVIALVQKREDDLLIAIDDFCITRILNRLRVGEGSERASDPMARELSAINVSVIERAHDLEGAVREVGQEICAWLRRQSGDGRSLPAPPAGAEMTATRPAPQRPGPGLPGPRGAKAE